jgi:actin-related protein
MCYVALNAEKERAYCQQSKTIERLYKLPDGQDIYMNETRFMLPEVLFQPSLVQSLPTDKVNWNGWHTTVHETISLCDRSIQAEMFGNIVLAGGNTLFPHLDERLQKEMSFLAPKGTVVKCVAFPNRQYAAWIGASIVASLSTFPCMWVSKSEYDDYGASIIHRKC